MTKNVYNIVWADDEIDDLLDKDTIEELESKGFKIIGQAHDGEELESILSKPEMVDAVIVDANHSNSAKQYIEQIRISKEILHSRRHSSDIKGFVKGLMIESYIEDGNQKVGEGIYGKSITDPCLGWAKTEQLLYDIADLL